MFFILSLGKHVATMLQKCLLQLNNLVAAAGWGWGGRPVIDVTFKLSLKEGTRCCPGENGDGKGHSGQRLGFQRNHEVLTGMKETSVALALVTGGRKSSSGD